MTTASSSSLHEIDFGVSHTISYVSEEFFNAQTLRRLAELGFRPGITVQTLQRTSGNGRVVAIDGVRYALDKHSTQNIFVEVVIGT